MREIVEKDTRDKRERVVRYVREFVREFMRFVRAFVRGRKHS